MNVLDENIDRPQRQQLQNWKIHFRHIGTELGRLGMEDQQQIIPLLHALRRQTFFTLDRDFSRPKLCHAGDCLVYLNVEPDEAATYIRHFLRHKSFRIQAQRMGKVIRVRPTGLSWWEIGSETEHVMSW